MNQNQKVTIITLGCPKNTQDTSNLARVLKARGHNVVQDAAEADAIVVHTCSFIEAAKKESIDTILQAGRLKGKNQRLIVTGCLVQQHGQEIFNELPEVDAFLGTGQLGQVAEVLERPRKRFLDRANPGGFMDPDATAVQSPRAQVSSPRTSPRHPSPWAYLRLSEGCSHPCSFCVIPRLRGPVQSRTKEQILGEVLALAGQGVEELVVIAQDTGDWGRERQSRDQNTESRERLPELLRAIGAVKGIRWVRLMYMHSASFTDELLRVFSEHPDKFPYLDMPLQHIDSRMLADMKRKSDESSLRGLLAKIRTHAPRLALRTTFIVGAPGESDAQFERLLNFVQEGHFDYLGGFTYSKEEGTPMAARRDQIPQDLKQARLDALTQAHFDVAQKKSQARLGQMETVVLDEVEGEFVLGRTCREAPEIDAVVRLPKAGKEPKGFVQAELTAYDAYEFSARKV